MRGKNSGFLEIARVLVRFDPVTRFIVNANHGIMRAAEKLGVADCVSDCVGFAVPQTTEWQRIGNWIEAAMISGDPRPRASLLLRFISLVLFGEFKQWQTERVSCQLQQARSSSNVQPVSASPVAGNVETPGSSWCVQAPATAQRHR